MVESRWQWLVAPFQTQHAGGGSAAAEEMATDTVALHHPGGVAVASPAFRMPVEASSRLWAKLAARVVLVDFPVVALSTPCAPATLKSWPVRHLFRAAMPSSTARYASRLVSRARGPPRTRRGAQLAQEGGITTQA